MAEQLLPNLLDCVKFVSQNDEFIAQIYMLNFHIFKTVKSPSHILKKL